MEGTGECYQSEGNAQSTVEITRVDNSYPAMCRWSQNNEGFLKCWIFERREIGIVRANSLTDAVYCTHALSH